MVSRLKAFNVYSNLILFVLFHRKSLLRPQQIILPDLIILHHGINRLVEIECNFCLSFLVLFSGFVILSTNMLPPPVFSADTVAMVMPVEAQGVGVVRLAAIEAAVEAAIDAARCVWVAVFEESH